MTETSPPESTAPTPLDAPGRRALKLMVWVFVAFWLSRLLTLGVYPLMDQTEGRYADIAREMIAAGDWTVGMLDPDFPFLGKPPLSFWATALSYKILGLNEFAARFPAFLFTLGSALLTMHFVRRWRGIMAAWRTGLILSSFVLFAYMTGGVMTDPALLFSLTLTMLGFAHCVVLGSKNPVYGYLFFIGLGLGVLSKGLIAIVFPGAAIALWLLKCREIKSLARLPWVTGTLLFLLITVPWHLLAEKKYPGFLNYYFIGEHFKRFTDPNWQGDPYGSQHTFPKGTIWAYWLVGTLPFSLYAIFRFVRDRRSVNFKSLLGRVPFLFIAFGLVPLTFFTASSHLLLSYPLPVLPATAILLDLLLFDLVPRRAPIRPFWKHCAFASGIVAFGMFAASIIVAPIIGHYASQKKIVRLFDENKSFPDTKLIFVDETPQSGDFYSRGRAIYIDEYDSVTLIREIEADSEAIFIVEDGDLEDFLKLDTHKRLRLVQTQGKYSMLTNRRT